MAKSTLDTRNINGILHQTIIESSGRMVVKKTQDLEPILDNNKVERDNFDGFGRDMIKVASIPNQIVEELMKKKIWNDKKKFKAWLNDPDNRAFRTSTGKV